jgi:Tfp pilus assembly protein PilN
MRAVNLLPRDERRQKTRAEQLPLIVGTALGVLVTLVLCVGFLMSSSGLKSKQAELTSLNDQLRLMPEPPPPPSPIETGLRDQEKARVSALSSALSRRVSWDRILREVSLVLPDDVWLTSLSATSPSSPATAAPAPAKAPTAPPTGFTINGYTYSHASVARLLSRLSVLPDIQNVQLQRSSLSPVGTQHVVGFTIVADIRPPGASS